MCLPCLVTFFLKINFVWNSSRRVLLRCDALELLLCALNIRIRLCVTPTDFLLLAYGRGP
jgi:hypothetical protein